MSASTVKTPATSDMAFVARLLATLECFPLLWADQCIDLLAVTLPDRAYLLTPLLRGERTVGAHRLNLGSGAVFEIAALLHGTFGYTDFLPAGLATGHSSRAPSDDWRTGDRNLGASDGRQRTRYVLAKQRQGNEKHRNR